MKVDTQEEGSGRWITKYFALRKKEIFMQGILMQCPNCGKWYDEYILTTNLPQNQCISRTSFFYFNINPINHF